MQWPPCRMRMLGMIAVLPAQRLHWYCWLCITIVRGGKVSARFRQRVSPSLMTLSDLRHCGQHGLMPQRSSGMLRNTCVSARCSSAAVGGSRRSVTLPFLSTRLKKGSGAMGTEKSGMDPTSRYLAPRAAPSVCSDCAMPFAKALRSSNSLWLLAFFESSPLSCVLAFSRTRDQNPTPGNALRACAAAA
jgi:hypothetical protein